MGRARLVSEPSSSGSRYFSWLPTTRSTPARAAAAAGSVWAWQPVTTTKASGFSRTMRRISWRSEKSARPVTVQVLMTWTWAGAPGSTTRKPAPSSRAPISCDSTWFRRQPSVESATVTGALTR